MKWIRALVGGFLFFSFSVMNAQRDYRNDAAHIKQAFDTYHYQPPAYDDAFSEAIWETVLLDLDPFHLYFTAQDIAVLAPFRTTLDEEWKGEGWNFLPRLTEVYRDALHRGQRYLEVEAGREISWEVTEPIILKEKRMIWPPTEAAQRSRWRSWIKYKVLTAVRDRVSGDSTQTLNEQTQVSSRGSEFRKEALMEESRRTSGLRTNPATLERYVASSFFRAITTCYDTHSWYFSPRDFESFESLISTKEYTYGIELKADPDGNIVITDLLPGGSAWKSGELHPGDLLLDIKLEGQPTVDLRGIGLDPFLDLLDESTSSTMTITVKSAKALTKSVTLQREKIETQDNLVKGFVLTGEKKIGYVALPGFYTDWGPDERSSANDVAAEIIKLKGEKIDGLILDIRANGGGSLFEAIEMIGIFIDQGPLAMIRRRGGKIETLRDRFRGTVYDGPLTIMIDGESASASEILASAIQDYRRGIIVGSKSFGKATGQVVISLDTIGARNVPRPGGGGFVTVTDERIYRVTGKSNQGWGIRPDIVLPDIHEAAVFHEIAKPHSFTPDSLSKKAFFAALPELPIAVLNAKSLPRIHEDLRFAVIEKLALQLTAEAKETIDTVTLVPGHFAAFAGGEVTKTLRHRAAVLFKIDSPQFNSMATQNDVYLKRLNEGWINDLGQDPYLREAFRITCDYISLTK
jgi:carboxyl-terminal processing protease